MEVVIVLHMPSNFPLLIDCNECTCLTNDKGLKQVSSLEKFASFQLKYQESFIHIHLKPQV